MPPPNECQEEAILIQLCQEAVQALDDLLSSPPRERRQIVDDSARAIVRLRDCLIERCRRETTGSEAPALRSALDQVNIAVSLITGVEYPGTGMQEKPMLQARDIIKALHF